MAFVDSEIIMDALETFLKANLNTQITAMNTEKGGSITLASIGNEAYFFQTLTNLIANFTEFLVFGEERIEVDQITSASGQAYRYIVSIILVDSDNNEDETITRKLFRYRRVLVDLFNKNATTIVRGLKFQVTALQPTDMFRLPHSDNNHRAIAILLETNFS